MIKNLYYTDAGVFNNGRFGHQQATICVTDHFGNIYLWEEIGDKTSNQGELTAILRLLQETKGRKLNILSDSQLAVNLINRKWKTKHPRLLPIIEQIWSLNRKFTLKWIRRDLNMAGWLIEERLGL